MKKIYILLCVTVLAGILFIPVTAEDGLLPKSYTLFGVIMPDIRYAIGREADKLETKQDGATLRFNSFTSKEYEAFGYYANAVGLSVKKKTYHDGTLNVELEKDGASILFEYNYNKQEASLFYPSGVQIEREKSTVVSWISILPPIDSTFGAQPMPSLGEILHRYPISETKNTDGSIIQFWNDVTNEDFDAFSKYLVIVDAVLLNYEIKNNILTAQIGRNDRVIIFSYDPQNLTATVTYPKDTFDQRSIEAEKNYKAAEINMMEKHYADACIELLNIRDYEYYRDVDTLLFRNYQSAIELRRSGMYEEAIAIFTALGNYYNSAEQIKETKYQAAVSLKMSRKYEEAISAFTALGNYRDASVQISESYYEKGIAERLSRNWDESVNAFELAGQYEDAEIQIQATRYLEGGIKRSIKDWDGAVKAFEQAGMYTDAEMQIYATRYAEGDYKRSAENWDGAIKAYEQAGNYRDALEQIKETHYLHAKELTAKGDYTDAVILYNNIRDYKDVFNLLNNDINLSKAVVKIREEKFMVGNLVKFGTYPQTFEGKDNTPIEWLVLARSEQKALLLSRYALDVKPYNTRSISISWETCTLRTWLNSYFLQKAFSKEEQSAILITNVDKRNSPKYSKWNTDGGKNTQDKIFLLSIEEANKYLDVINLDESNHTNNKNNNSLAILSYFTFTKNPDKAVVGYNVVGEWWLRSPGNSQNTAAYVNTQGNYHFTPVSIDWICVRPALWVNLESGLF